MTSSEASRIVVLMATTDRPEPFSRLAADLAAAATRVDADVVLGLVENSRIAASRAANTETVARLHSRGLEVFVSEAGHSGASIGEARASQRELLRSIVSQGRRPALVWMLDDDLRFCRLVVQSGVLRREPLLDPLGALLDLGRTSEAPDVLVGTVHGDPPIPAIATWASRISDMAANIERMVRLGADSVWPCDHDTLRRLGEADYYYDYGRHPELETPAYWLPRHVEQKTSEALFALLEEARHLPSGVALTRPLVEVQTSERTGRPAARVLGPAQVRGGNTVFYDIDACLRHEYPTAEFGGVRTRRSDSVGMLALRAKHGMRVLSSDFAVLHERDREESQRPNSEQLVRHLVADTLGAALTRGVAGADSESIGGFLRARVRQIDGSLGRMAAAIARLRELVGLAPPWMEAAGLHEFAFAPDGVLAWFDHHVPGLAESRLPEPTRSELLATAAAEQVARVAAGWAERGPCEEEVS